MGYASMSLSWDDGDALTQSDLGVQPSPSWRRPPYLLGVASRRGDDRIDRSVLNLRGRFEPDAATFVAPDGIPIALAAGVSVGGTRIHSTSASPMFSRNWRHGVRAFSRRPFFKTRPCFSSVWEPAALTRRSSWPSAVSVDFILVDRDRLSVGNVVRHPGGISQVGRYKVNVVRDLIHEKNPEATYRLSRRCRL